MLVHEVNPDGDAFETEDTEFLANEEDLEGLSPHTRPGGLRVTFGDTD